MAGLRLDANERIYPSGQLIHADKPLSGPRILDRRRDCLHRIGHWSRPDLLVVVRKLNAQRERSALLDWLIDSGHQSAWPLWNVVWEIIHDRSLPSQ